ncbi:MAG: endonuclease, partial [Clostridiales bacterium]
MAFVYILECSDGSLYTGWTSNLEKRIARHNEGKASKYTRSKRPVVLKYFE